MPDQRGGGFAAAGEIGAHLQHVALAGGEIHPDRIELHDGGEHGRRVGADQLADRDLPRGHHAVERRGHVGIAEIDLGLPFIGLRGLQVGLRGVALRQRLVVIGLGRHLLGHQSGLPVIFGLRLGQGRLVADHGGLGRVHLELVRLRLDGEQRRALLDEVAVLVADRLHEALHARDQIDRIDGRRVAGRFEIAGDVLLDRRGDRDLRRRRRGIFVILAAGGDAGGNRQA